MTVSSAISALSPKHWYKLDETSGTTATDSGSGGLNGTYTGSPTLAQSTANAPDGGNYVQLDGSTQYVVCGGVTDFKYLHNNGVSGTILGFFKQDTAGADSADGYFATNGLSELSEGLGVYWENRSAATLDDSGPFVRVIGSKTVTSTNAVRIWAPGNNDTNWHFIAVTKSDQKFILYIDGTLVGQAWPNDDNLSASNNSTYSLYLGVTGSHYLDGHMAHIAVWESALTEAQLRTIWTPFIEGGGAGAGTGTLSLVLRDTSGNAQANLTGLRWWYYADTPANVVTNMLQPVASGSGATTDASGNFSVTSITGVGVAAGTGYIVITDSDGVPASSQNAGAIAVTLV